MIKIVIFEILFLSIIYSIYKIYSTIIEILDEKLIKYINNNCGENVKALVSKYTRELDPLIFRNEYIYIEIIYNMCIFDISKFELEDNKLNMKLKQIKLERLRPCVTKAFNELSKELY